jgi:hypothetical protein
VQEDGRKLKDETESKDDGEEDRFLRGGQPPRPEADRAPCPAFAAIGRCYGQGAPALHGHLPPIERATLKTARFARMSAAGLSVSIVSRAGRQRIADEAA